MKFLSTIIFLLFPTIVFGGIGDVYYCTGENLVRIENYKVKQYKPQNFKFRRSENQIKFGSEDNYLKDIILNEKIFSVQEMFSFTNQTKVFVMNYKNGKFHYTSNTYRSITILTGKCSIF